jgi:hypothetical protein
MFSFLTFNSEFRDLSSLDSSAADLAVFSVAVDGKPDCFSGNSCYGQKREDILKQEARSQLAKLTDAQIGRLAKELGWYALSVSKKLFWRTRNSVELPKGETVDSIVSLAFEKLYSGEREWEPQKDPDLKKYLMDVIDSLLYHLSTSKDNTLLSATSEFGQEEIDWEAGSKERRPEREWLAASARTPEQLLIDAETAQREERVLDELAKACREDDQLTRILRAIRTGCDQPGEIAKATGIPIKDIYSASKRLDRKAAAIRNQMEANQATKARRK